MKKIIQNTHQKDTQNGHNHWNRTRFAGKGIKKGQFPPNRTHFGTQVWVPSPSPWIPLGLALLSLKARQELRKTFGHPYGCPYRLERNLGSIWLPWRTAELRTNINFNTKSTVKIALGYGVVSWVVSLCAMSNTSLLFATPLSWCIAERWSASLLYILPLHWGKGQG